VWQLFQIFSAYGIPSKIINAIRCVYDNSHSFVSTQEGDTASFPVQTGVLQVDTLAPFLFIIVLDYVLRGSMTPEFRLTLKRRQSARHSAVFLTDLDFADDIALYPTPLEMHKFFCLPWSALQRKLVFSLTNRKPKHLSLMHVQQMTSCHFRLVQ